MDAGRILKLFLGILLIFAVGITSSAGESIAKINMDSSWRGSVFGDVGGQTGISAENFRISENNNESVTIKVSNNKGKIAGGSDGIAYYYQELGREDNFELSARVNIEAYASNNQVSLGLMVRDEVLVNESDSKMNGDYIAAGPLGLAGEAHYTFNRREGTLSREGRFTINPMPGTSLDIKIKKAGNTYKLSVGDEEPVVIDNFNFEGDKLYAGLYAVRNASVTFEDIQLVVADRKALELEVVAPEKREYLPGQEMDLTGMAVTALYEDGRRAELAGEEYIVSGFDTSQVGETEIVINHNGAREAVKVDVVPLSISKLNINFFPVRTEYFIGDVFDPLGLELDADYNNGYMYRRLEGEYYSVYIDNAPVDEENPFVFDKSGEYTVTLVSTEDPEARADIPVTVSNSILEEIDIAVLPEVTQYFIGDELDLDGMVAYAVYTDGSRVRLGRKDYTVSGFSSRRRGDKRIMVAHKDKVGEFTVNVKRRESKGLAVTRYPRTTFPTGSELNLEGMVVEEIFDNGDLGALKGLKIDTSKVDMDTPGIYEIKISARGKKDTTLKVTVRDEGEVEWKEIVFGQSTNGTRNYIKRGEDHIEVTALEGGGKITGDHDGISFYYVELDASENFILSADISVVDYAKNPHDGQESFGIMARDAIGPNLDSSVFASNIAAVGGFSAGTRYPNGTQLFVRTGVEAPNGEGSQGIQKVMMEEGKPQSSYRLTLSKTNSGFTGRIDDGDEFIIYEPEILTSQSNKMYVGFFAARLATIEVSNIDLQVSAAATDASMVVKPVEAATPSLEVESLAKVSESEYKLLVRPSVKGVISVKMGGEMVAREIPVAGGELVEIPANLEDVHTRFAVILIPDDTEVLTSLDTVVENFSVEVRSYREGKDIFVSPEGTERGDGSRDNPLDLDTAIHFVQPGQKIVLMDGVYVRHNPLEILKYNDGREGAMKSLVADGGARPVIDFDRIGRGMEHSGNYWHIYGIDFARSAGNHKGYTLGGSHNIIEFSRFYENGDTGFQISRTDNSDNIEDWPSYNLVLNSDSFNNVDPSENNADGFGAKLTIGRGNVFDGCMAYNNIDDGWDLYTKVGSGAIGPVVIKNSVAFNNGYIMNNEPGGGDGNGFKLGGEGVHVPHLIKDSVAFGNIANGYSSNSNPGVIARNNIGFNNQRNALFVTYTDIQEDFQIEGFISYHYNNDLEVMRDNVPEENHNGSNFFFDGSKFKNTLGEEIDRSNFSNLVTPEVILRKADGSIDFDFLRFIP